jgi:hypothetical protein
VADDLGIDLSAFDRLGRQLVEMGDEAMPALAATLFERAEYTMTRSKETFVPVDKGILRGSGYVEPPVIDGLDVSVTLGYGGPAGAYALKQHEDETLNHPRGGQAKYLSDPVQETAATLGEDLADGIAAAFERRLKK